MAKIDEKIVSPPVPRPSIIEFGIPGIESAKVADELEQAMWKEQTTWNEENLDFTQDYK